MINAATPAYVAPPMRYFGIIYPGANAPGYQTVEKSTKLKI